MHSSMSHLRLKRSMMLVKDQQKMPRLLSPEATLILKRKNRNNNFSDMKLQSVRGERKHRHR